MRAGRILGFLVGGVIALSALVMLSVWRLGNPNDYKPKIAAAVKDATGRELVLQGDIKLSVFPWIALELGSARLGNPPGFSDQPFVSFQHAAVRAKLLPLIHERLEIARVEIDGLDVRLERNAEGTGNWAGFGRAEAQPSDTGAQAGGHVLDGLAGIKVTHARVSYQKVTLENFNLETAPFADGVVPISIRFDANRGVATEHATVEAKVDFSNPGGRHYRLAALTMIGQASLAGDDRPLRWNMSTPGVDIDLDAQTLAVPMVALTVAGAQLNGSVQATKIRDDMTVMGSATLAPVVLHEFMPRWGLSNPQMHDPRAFSQVSGSAAFTYGENALRFDTVRLTLDDTHIEGGVAVENLDRPALRFNLSADHIDVDRYLPPEGQPREPARPAVQSAEPSRPLEAEGTLAIGSVHLSRLDLTDLQLTLSAKDGLMHVFPLQAQLGGGRYSGNITLDSRGTLPVFSMDEHLSGVDVGKLLASNGRSIHLSGKGTIAVKASGHGAAADAILKTLNGHVDASLTEGAVEGIDLGYELGRAEALIRRESAPTTPNTNRTQFDAFKTSADITNGIAQTKDLMISSPALRVTGQGSTNLASKAIDFTLLADTLRTVQGVSLQIPVKVTGTTADPSIRPDIEALAKGQLRQKLQDVLHDKLQGLFGRP
jgi:AsmA protein